MTLKELLHLIRALNLEHLTCVNEIVLCGIWDGKTYLEIARESHYGYRYIKNTGQQLLRLFSDTLNIPIKKNNFRVSLEEIPAKEAYEKFGVNLPLPSNLPNLVSDFRFPTYSSRPEPPDSNFYIERPPIESIISQEILQPGALVRIKAPKEFGKTSLMNRILSDARKTGYSTVALSLDEVDRQSLTDLDKFLRWFCASFARKLDLEYKVEDDWSDTFGSKSNCKAFFEDYVLLQANSPLVLALDRVDALFPHSAIADDFFALLRCWYEEAAYGDSGSQLWAKMRLIVVHSTEIYIPVDINKSPFNVGLAIELQPFTREQVEELAQRHELNLSQDYLIQLMQLVAGHPYLVRVVLYHLARKEVSVEQLLETAAIDGGIYRHHLCRHWAYLQQHPQLVAAYARVVRASAPVELEQTLAFKLHSMGLVNLHSNKVIPSCELYRQYFRTVLPSDFDESQGKIQQR